MRLLRQSYPSHRETSLGPFLLRRRLRPSPRRSPSPRHRPRRPSRLLRPPRQANRRQLTRMLPLETSLRPFLLRRRLRPSPRRARSPSHGPRRPSRLLRPPRQANRRRLTRTLLKEVSRLFLPRRIRWHRARLSRLRRMRTMQQVVVVAAAAGPSIPPRYQTEARRPAGPIASCRRLMDRDRSPIRPAWLPAPPAACRTPPVRLTAPVEVPWIQWLRRRMPAGSP